jgi:predicted SprT family Zn-dependent metalloprotease
MDILAIAHEEQARARAIVAKLGPCPIVLSRATTVLGSFNVDPHSGEMEIRLSKHLPDEAQIRETMRHELAHQAAWERYREIGHGGYWKTMANYLGCEPVACTRGALDVAVQREKYEIACLTCGWATRRQRRSKLIDRPWRFACARCGGKLVVTTLDPVAP